MLGKPAPRQDGAMADTQRAGPGEFRVEHDTMGEVRVPARALWGAQTQRAVENFPISGVRVEPGGHPRAGPDQGGRGRGQRPARRAGRRTSPRPSAPRRSEVADGEHDDQFPIDVFQTGSGTSTNMNVNEVVARLATRAARPPGAPQRPGQRLAVEQRHVPHRLHLAATAAVVQDLVPALEHLADSLQRKAIEFADVVKAGPHAPDGRRPGDARPGVRRLRRAGARRRRRGCARRCPGSPRCRSAARPSAPASTPRPGSPAQVVAELAPDDRPAADRGARPLRGAGRRATAWSSCPASCAPSR